MKARLALLLVSCAAPTERVESLDLGDAPIGPRLRRSSFDAGGTITVGLGGGVYDHDETALPFHADLPEVVARALWGEGSEETNG